MSPVALLACLPMGAPVLLVLVVSLGLGSCQGNCPLANCTCEHPLVDCTRRDLNNFPEGLPMDTRRLILVYNNLTSLSSMSFNILMDLVYLDCSHNSLRDPLEGTFVGQPLIYLDLSYNLLENIVGSPFNMLPSLVVLKLKHNPLKTIEKDVFSSNMGLRELDLSSAHLKYLDVSTVSSLVNLRVVDLSENPWHCSCELRDLCIWIQSASISFSNPTKIVCATTTTGDNLQLAAVTERLNRYCFTNLKKNDYVFLMLIGFVIFSLGTVVAWVAGICIVLRNRLCRSSDDDEEYIEEEVVPEGQPPSRQLEKEDDHAFYVNAYV